jgi:hypothetical protein
VPAILIAVSQPLRNASWTLNQVVSHKVVSEQLMIEFPDLALLALSEETAVA